jgi:hypothetical protein
VFPVHHYNCYNIDEIPDFIEQPNSDTSTDYNSSDSIVSNQKEVAQSLDGPMNSPWPMYCHDVRHTGRSPIALPITVFTINGGIKVMII